MTVTFAGYWSDILPEDHRDALHRAFLMWCTQYLDGQWQFLVEDLPEKYLPRYTGLFERRFFFAMSTVGYKLAQSHPPSPLLSCTAEELALDILIESASAFLTDERGIEPKFGVFRDVAFQDHDFEFLYDLKYDGIEDSAIGRMAGMGHMHFDEWFKPFLNATAQVHPYGADD